MANEADVEYLEDLPQAVGFPHKIFPTSWFQVDWTDALKPGDVKPLKYFGKDLVLYRTEDGEAILSSAFCPHMGAHLGHGGVVDGAIIRCPYHGWEWGKDGRNTLVPSDGCPSTTRRVLKKWLVHESNGIIWTWYDSLGRDPLWDPPAERRDERDFLPAYPHCTYKWEAVHTHPQYIVENTVDVEHLIWVHKNKLLEPRRKEEDLPQLVEDGHIFRLVRKPPQQQTSSHGLGTVLVDFIPDPDRPHRAPSLLWHSTTPIDHETSDMFGTCLVEQDRSAEGGDGVVPVGNAFKRVEQQLKQAGRDVPIWDNMVYMLRPAYSKFEGKMFMTVRRFADKFYPASDDMAQNRAPAESPSPEAVS